MWLPSRKTRLPLAAEALPGRETPVSVPRATS